MLMADAGHHLHADADAEERHAACFTRSLQRLAHARHARQRRAAVAEGADARQHQPVGPAHHLGIGGDDDLLRRPGSAAARSNAFAAERRLPEP